MLSLPDLAVGLTIVTMVCAVLAGTHRLSAENYAERSVNMDTLTRDLAIMGLNANVSNPSAPVKAFVSLVPTLDDLLSSKYLKREYTRGLAGATTISGRTCVENDGSRNDSLVAAMDSNKRDCGLTVDLQQYDFKATTMNLQVDAKKSTATALFVSQDAQLVEFLLRRPVFFTIDNSKPYVVDWGRRFLFTTKSAPKVAKHRDAGAAVYKLPIKQAPTTSTDFFPAQHANIPDILAAKAKRVKSVGATGTIQVSATLYFLKRKANFGNKVALADGNIAKRVDSSAYIKNILSQYKLPPSNISAANLKNPTMTIEFKVFIRPEANKGSWLYKYWSSLVSLGGNAVGSCDARGRGGAVIELRPESQRLTAEYAEAAPIDPNWACMDFSNVENDANTGATTDACGGVNRGQLWIPTGVPVDVAYIFSATMKVMTASWYDNATKKRQFTMAHMYSSNATVNGILSTVTRMLDELHIVNQTKLQNFDANILKIKDIAVSYGMADLHEWYFSPNSAAL